MLLSKRVLYLVVLAIVFVIFAPSVESQQPGQQSSDTELDALAAEMAVLIRKVSESRHQTGKVKRFNQAKSLGCFDAEFSVNDDVPNNLKHGVFAAPGDYRASVRFANASTVDDGDKDLRGLSIRVFGVPGDVVWGMPGQQDFVFNSHPVLFASTPEEFRDFIQAQLDDSIFWYFLNPFDSHLGALMILLDARDRPNSPFDIRYWSTTPSRLGRGDKVVKYSVRSCSDYQSPEPDDYSQNYMRAAMHTHLQQTDACFDFMLQLQTNEQDMPIDDSSALWDEEQSPFIPVAQLTIKKQEFLSKHALEQCETVEFNPWQSLVEHEPLGRMNYVRRQIYAELAAFRRQINATRASLNPN